MDGAPIHLLMFSTTIIGTFTKGTLKMGFAGTDLTVKGNTFWIGKRVMRKKLWKLVLSGEVGGVFWQHSIEERNMRRHLFDNGRKWTEFDC
jgi:hypothetical protein